MMKTSEIFRAIFSSHGPRRDEAERVSQEVKEAVVENRVSVLKNKRAVKLLADETIARLEHAHGNSFTRG